MKLFIVKMERNGSYSSYSYIEGVFDSEFKANLIGKMSELKRGGKYVSRVFMLRSKKDNPKEITLIENWESNDDEAFHSLEFKIIGGDCTPRFKNGFITTQMFKVKNWAISGINLSEMELDYAVGCLEYFTTEEQRELASQHEKFIRQKYYNS